jgi:phosphatidylglycerophosphate synthase
MATPKSAAASAGASLMPGLLSLLRAFVIPIPYRVVMYKAMKITISDRYIIIHHLQMGHF